MKDIIVTRLFLWKKEWLSHLFWLLFPIIGTMIAINIGSALQKDSGIPVGIVLEEETSSAIHFYDSLQSENPYLRLYRVDKDEALQKLEKHEYDSVFVVRRGFEEQLQKGNRNRLIYGYHSNVSFAYPTIKEMVVSQVQQETGRYKTAYFIDGMAKKYTAPTKWNHEEVIEKTREIQKEENLLRTSFSYSNAAEGKRQNGQSIFNPWHIWALFALLSTFLLLDWPIKEQAEYIKVRFHFIIYPMPNYLLKNLLLYICLFLLVDLMTMAVFSWHFAETPEISFIATLFSYRIMITALAFLIANCFSNGYVFYGFSFILTLITGIAGGAIIPIDRLNSRFDWLVYLNPQHDFLAGKISVFWTILLMIGLFGWYKWKAVKAHA